MTCPRCLKPCPVLPYRVQSEIIDLMVCPACAIEAVQVSHWPGPGKLIVTLKGEKL